MEGGGCSEEGRRGGGEEGRRGEEGDGKGRVVGMRSEGVGEISYLNSIHPTLWKMKTSNKTTPINIIHT